MRLYHQAFLGESGVFRGRGGGSGAGGGKRAAFDF